MLDLIPIAAVRASVVLNYSWCGVRLDHRRREVGLTNDYPRLDESLSVLVERFPSLQPLAGAEFLNNGTLYLSMKAANKTRQDKVKYSKITMALLEVEQGQDHCSTTSLWMTH